MGLLESEEVYKKIIAKIRQTRMEKGISQKEIAEHLGIKQAAYSACENGNNKFSAVSLFAALDYLGIDITDKPQNQSNTNKSNLPSVQETQDLVTFDINDMMNMRKEVTDINQKIDEILELFKKKKK
jgi:transcriptional regulator with XRE-family HTH domain